MVDELFTTRTTAIVSLAFRGLDVRLPGAPHHGVRRPGGSAGAGDAHFVAPEADLLVADAESDAVFPLYTSGQLRSAAWCCWLGR